MKIEFMRMGVAIEDIETGDMVEFCPKNGHIRILRAETIAAEGMRDYGKPEAYIGVDRGGADSSVAVSKKDGRIESVVRESKA